ncbi:MAG: glycosyltransferase, partial [Faecalispora jeddahensis]
GAHGVANALDSYVEAGELLRDKKIKLLLVGQGPERERLIQKINDLELNDVVEALPAVKRDEVPGLLEQLDALYVGLQRQPLFRFGVSPNKLMDYMMAAKPVIFAIEAGNDMVADAKCGISIPPEDPAEIARAAQILASTPKAELETMGKHGQDYILKHHEYDVLSNRFLEVLAQAK